MDELNHIEALLAWGKWLSGSGGQWWWIAIRTLLMFYGFVTLVQDGTRILGSLRNGEDDNIVDPRPYRDPDDDDYYR